MALGAIDRVANAKNSKIKCNDFGEKVVRILFHDATAIHFMRYTRTLEMHLKPPSTAHHSRPFNHYEKISERRKSFHFPALIQFQASEKTAK